MKLLFADDQIPWEDAERDNRVFSEIKIEKAEYFKNRGKTVEDAYQEDKEWISELIHFLKTELVPRHEVISEQEYESAKRRIENEEDIAVAIIDLSWTGDCKLPRGKRSNVGTELISLLKDKNSNVTVIAFSQNYASQPALMDKVVQMGAFPLQKTYTQVDKQALASAIAFLTKNIETSKTTKTKNLSSQTTGSNIWDIIRDLPKIYIPIILGLIISATWFLAHVNTEVGEYVAPFGIELYIKGKNTSQ